MEQQIFCDGIGRISIIGGVVRLDLFTYSPSETDANGNPRPVLTHRVVMGTEGFLRSSEKVMEAVQVIGRSRQQQPAPANQAGPPSPAQGAPAPQWPPQQQAPQPPRPQQPSPPQPPQPQAKAPEAPAPAKPPFP